MTTLELLRESFGAGTIFSPFYTESLFTDIILVAAGDPTLTFKAHRVVLSAASPYLARKIRGYKDSEGPLVLPYIRFNTLKAILDYIYHGRGEVSRFSYAKGATLVHVQRHSILQ